MVVDEMGYHIQFLLLISFCLMLSCHGLQFKVGNQRGWAVNPSEKYNDWAGRLRFQVNDTLRKISSFNFSFLYIYIHI